MRSPLNSESLRTSNKTLYRTFCANYPFIVSSCGGTILTGTFAGQVCGTGLHQKVPLRNYLGIKLTNDKRVEFVNHGTYDCFSDKFIFLDIKQENIDKLKLFQREISKALGKEVGVKAGVLNELPRRTGLNNPGANAANLTSALLLISEQISISDLNKFQNHNHDLETDKRELIKNTARLFHSAWLGRDDSGFGVFSSLANSTDLLVYNPKAQYPIIPIGDIFKSKLAPSTQFDVIIIGTSDRFDIDFSFRKYDEIGNLFSISDSDLDQYNKSFGSSVGQNFSPSLRTSYFNTVDSTSLATVITMGKYINNPNKENLHNCLELFSNTYNSISLFGDNFTRKNQVHTLIKRFFYEKFNDMPYAITTGLTNNLVLITPNESIRKDFDNLCEYIKENINFDISYPYVSWLDDSDKNGVVLEKWSKFGASPDFAIKNSLYVYSIDTSYKTVLINGIDSKEGLEREYDILLDEDDKKIYINGKKITSKELPTVATTINLMELITDSDNFEVFSDKMPDQSYFKDRNELQSKIISPLKKYVDRETHKSINLKITGGLIDYKVSLYPSEVSIAIIRRQ